jgi:hypothetical protein
MTEATTKRARKTLTARERAAKALAEYEKYIVEAEAEGIEGLLKATNIVAEYNKMKKDEANKEVADYVILAAIAKAVGAKGVEITKKKAATRTRSASTTDKKSTPRRNSKANKDKATAAK